MKKLIFLFSFFAFSFAVIAQDDPKDPSSNCPWLYGAGDWDNAILVLNQLIANRIKIILSIIKTWSSAIISKEILKKQWKV